MRDFGQVQNDMQLQLCLLCAIETSSSALFADGGEDFFALGKKEKGKCGKKVNRSIPSDTLSTMIYGAYRFIQIMLGVFDVMH